jgi:hypothetical protein
MSVSPNSVLLAVNSSIPEPDPLAVYFSVCPEQAFSKVSTKPVIAFACAVDPLAVNVCLPPQSTFT